MKPTARALVVVLLMVIPATAFANHQLFVVLKYRIDPSLRACPSQNEFRKIVARQVGYDPFQSAAAHEVVVRADATGHGIDGSLVWSETNGAWEGERRFSSRHLACNEFLAGMGFAVAVQIQLLNSNETNALGTTEPTVPSRDSTTPASSAISSSDRRGAPTSIPKPHDVSVDGRPTPVATLLSVEPHRWSMLAGAGPSASLGLGPNLTGQARIFVAARYAWTSVELGGEVGLPTTARQSDGSGFRQSLIAATIAACGHGHRVAACGLGKVGQIRVHGFGVDNVGAPTGLVAQLGLRFSVALKLGSRLSLLPHAEALYVPTRWTVELNQAAVWTMPRFNASVGIDLAVRFR